MIFLELWEFLRWPQTVFEGKLIGKIQTMASMTTSEMLGTQWNGWLQGLHNRGSSGTGGRGDRTQIHQDDV